MEINFTKQDAETAENFFDRRNCLAGRALRRMFPDADIKVGGMGFRIGTQHYEFKGDVDLIQEAYDDIYKQGGFVNLERFEPFTLTAVETDELMLDEGDD